MEVYVVKFGTNKKAYAFKGAAALIVAVFSAAVLLFTGCPATHDSKPVMYKVTFGVDGGGGRPDGNGRQEAHCIFCNG